MVKVLFVDDEPMILRLFKSVLEMNGFTVCTANSAAEAIALLSTEKFQMVVTDLRMETSAAGFDVVTAARQLTPRPVLVILTAYPVPPAEWKSAGADALYVKGQNVLELPQELKQLLEAHESGDPLGRCAG